MPKPQPGIFQSVFLKCFKGDSNANLQLEPNGSQSFLASTINITWELVNLELLVLQLQPLKC